MQLTHEKTDACVIMFKSWSASDESELFVWSVLSASSVVSRKVLATDCV